MMKLAGGLFQLTAIEGARKEHEWHLPGEHGDNHTACALAAASGQRSMALPCDDPSVPTMMR
jgi:hypothetical protein